MVHTQQLASSAIASVSYDDEALTLEIEFAGRGQTYVFNSVPPTVYEGLVNASSPGSYYHQNIKGQYF